MTTIEQKRTELRKKYENWLKKNKIRFSIFILFYLIVMIINFVFLNNNKLTLLATLLLFSYSVYIYTLHRFVNKQLIKKIDNIDFKTD